MAPEALKLSKAEARRFLLRYHFLYPPHSLDGNEGVERVMERLRCIQVDPLDVAGKNVDLVLQSRVADFKPELLEDALYGRGRLVEAWDKLRSIIPVEDWHGLWAFRERMKTRHRESENPPQEVIDYVREEIARQGELTSLDLEDKGSADWRWAPAKAVRAALEIMFDWGEIGIAGRIGNRKIYTPMERLLEKGATDPAVTTPDAPLPDAGETREAYLRRHIRRRLKAVGIIAGRNGDGWLGIDKVTAAERARHLSELQEEGSLIAVDIEGLRYRCYLPAAAEDTLHMFHKESEQPEGVGRVATIAPLDNLLWDRRLIEDLFGFSYRWEVYKPKAQRQYGYYVLPLLQADRFIGRWEPRRGNGELEIRGWWWEPSVEVTPALKRLAREEVDRFRRFLGAKTVQGLELLRRR